MMGAIDRVFRGRRPSQERPLAAIIAGLWRNGEQGLEYDVPGFRDAWNSAGPNRTPTVASVFGEASVVSPGVYRVYSSAGAFSSVDAVAPTTAVVGRKYLVSFNVDSITTLGGGLVVESVENPPVTTLGPKCFLVTAANTSIHIKRNSSACDIQISGLSAQEWLGRDSCALYQDASGTLPAYMPGGGQVDPPVGLLLDKRKGFTKGVEVWSDASATFSGSSTRVSAGTYRIYTPDGTLAAVSHPVAVGKWYAVSFRVVSAAVPSVGLYVGPAASIAVFSAAALAAGGTVSGIVFTTGSTLSIARNASTTDITIDSVSIREISGNHAYQVSTPSRPTLSARYNGFLASEKFDDPYWTWQASFTSQKTSEITDPSGGFDAWKITSTNANAALSRAGLAGFRNPVFTMVAKAGTWTPSIMIRNATTAVNMVNAPLTSGDFTNSYGKYSARDLGGGWKEMKIEITSGVAVTDVLIAYLGSTGAIPVGQYMYLLRADFRESGDGVGLPPYQRVIDANTYDTMGFPLSLKFDGVDDSLLTAQIDLSAYDKMLLCIAAQKQADANCLLVEFGNSFSSEGAFGVQLPNAGGSFLAAWGTGTSVYRIITLPAAPASGVFSAYLDRSKPAAADAVTLRLNGAAAGGPGAGSPVAGTWGNNTLYIGRRTNASLPFKGRLFGLILRAGYINDSTVAKVERNLNQKAKVF